MLKIEGNKKELEMVEKALYNFLYEKYESGEDIFACEPCCRTGTNNCLICIQEYIKEDIIWNWKE